MRSRCALVWILSIGSLLAGTLASGQSYPRKSIRIVTSEAGGGTDFAARTVAQGIAGPLGQPIIVDNRGSGGNVS